MDDAELLRKFLNDPASEKQLFSSNEIDELLADNDGDVYLAAADGWRVKAARVSEWYRTGLDGSFLDRHQAWEHAMEMVKHFSEEGRGSLKSVELDTDYGASEEISEHA